MKNWWNILPWLWVDKIIQPTEGLILESFLYLLPRFTVWLSEEMQRDSVCCCCLSSLMVDHQKKENKTWEDSKGRQHARWQHRKHYNSQIIKSISIAIVSIWHIKYGLILFYVFFILRTWISTIKQTNKASTFVYGAQLIFRGDLQSKNGKRTTAHHIKWIQTVNKSKKEHPGVK